MKRFIKIQSKIQKVKDEGNSLLIMWDANVDLNPANDALGRFESCQLHEEYLNMINKLSLAQMNFEPTRHRVGHRSSLLDHFLTTNPEKVDGVETLKNHIADHSAVKLQYHAEGLKENPKLMLIRDNTCATRETLMYLIENNHRLNQSLAIENANESTNVIIEEYNAVINTAAPARVVQLRENNVPYVDNEVREVIEEADVQLTKAIEEGEREEWRQYKHKRNILYKYLERVKAEYVEKMLRKSKDMWRTVRNLYKTNKESVPNMIIEERSTVTSSKKMAEIFNCFYINKIKGIREKFKSSNVDTLEILEH